MERSNIIKRHQDTKTSKTFEEILHSIDDLVDSRCRRTVGVLVDFLFYFLADHTADMAHDRTPDFAAHRHDGVGDLPGDITTCVITAVVATSKDGCRRGIFFVALVISGFCHSLSNGSLVRGEYFPKDAQGSTLLTGTRNVDCGRGLEDIVMVLQQVVDGIVDDGSCQCRDHRRGQ